MDDLVLLTRFGYRHEAELARGFLRDAGIESALLVDDAGGAEVGLSFSNPARLLVRAGDVQRSKEVLAAAGVLEEPEPPGD